jgi:hypothetical protein
MVTVSRDAARVCTFLVSEIPPQLVQRLLLTPAASNDPVLELAAPDLPEDRRL